MPSENATLRASSISSRLQQVRLRESPASQLSKSFIVQPMHSFPASHKSFAATLESTPPLIAIKIFILLSRSPRESRALRVSCG